MTYLASAGAYVQTWIGRANQAYGPNRQWNVAPSFEDQAWTGSGYNQGVLWSDAAHDDPNVWTNRYNAGYAQATTDKQPPASIQGTDTTMGNVGPITRGVWTSASGSYTVPITGNYVLVAEARGSAWTIDEKCGGQIRIVWAGGTITGTMTHFRPEPYFDISGTMHSVFGTGLVTTGQPVHIEILVNADSSNNQLSFNQVVLRARFIPVQGYPH